MTMEIDENGNYYFDSIEELTYFLNTHEAENGQIYETEEGWMISDDWR